MQKLPTIKKATLVERITLPVDVGMKEEYDRLKDSHGIQNTEWARQVLRRELDKLKKQISA